MKFNTKKPTSKTENLAGGVAMSQAPEMELIVSCLSTFLEDKFYESGDERIERLQKLCKQVKPEFIGKLAIVARRDFHLRSVSHLLIGELAKVHKGDNLVSRVIAKAVERPDDLIEIVAYLNEGNGKKIKSHQVAKGIKSVLLRLTPYELAKYKGESNKIKLVDLFNAVHPTPLTKTQGELWGKLLKGELKNTETWEARLSSGEDKKKVWADMISEGKIGYMALLRNLRNIDNQSDEGTKKAACKMIADPARVKKSKQLPFRFYNAYENVSNLKMRDAISEALEISLDNVPHFDGDTLVAVDTSGSMTSGDGPIKKASIFGAVLAKANGADLVLYDTSLKEVRFVSKEPTVTLAEKIQQEAMGGGTQTSLVFQYAEQKKKKYSRIIILSDNESWSEGWYGGGGVQEIYNQYRKINDCYVYAIDIAGYGTKDVSSSKVFHLAGWSEHIMDFMSWVEKENQLVEFVNKTEI